jgi:hypothetical protein
MMEVGILPDTELQKVLDIAAWVGDIGQDDVNVSYTSMMIGLMWSDDATSQWLQQQQKQVGVNIGAIYGHRSLSEGANQQVLAALSAGRRPALRKDYYSVSAKTVLREAVSVAQETGQPPNASLGTRHVAAVYFFRNPPGHNTQLHQEWGFEREKWRRAFAQFIATGAYASEYPSWSSVLAGYVPDEPVSVMVSGDVLKGYQFETECVLVLRALELAVATQTPPMLSSEGLLKTLAAARSIPDCAAFADLVAGPLGVQGTIDLEPTARPFAPNETPHGVTHGLKNILDRSRNLTRSITETDNIGIRHIIASIVVVPDSTANLRLVQSGVRLPLLREKLLKEFTRRWLNDDGVQWRFHLVGSTPPTIAPFHTDAADRGDDRLDVTRYARAFGILIAAQKVSPPVSIGIFGDWGSGKSFFMRLMSEQTDAASKVTAKDVEGRRLFCERVVPIRFNAWHYAEGDLWASLVQTILQGLRNAVVGEGETESEQMDRILENLESAKLVRKNAEQALQSTRKEQSDCEKDLAAARIEAEKNAAAITEVKTRDVVKIVRDILIPADQTNEALKVAEHYLKLEGAAELAKKVKANAGEVEDLLNDSRVVVARTGSLWNWLWRAPVSGKAMATLGATTIGIFAAGLWLAAAQKQAWPAFYSAMAEAGAVFGLAIPWARRHLNTINKGLGQFESIRKQIDRKLEEERAEQRSSVARAEASYAETAAKVAAAVARLSAAQQRVAEAEREVEESRSVNRIARLLEDRLSNKSYERYLGIIAAIRADFEKLSKLMKKMREEGRGSTALQPIDRIVLYVDDLDRCPGEKVVRVLEAIHLLLAFELFVVVVGVDIRWAACSLAEKYPLHLSAGFFEGLNGNPALTAAGDGVSALDYLEKIFQIPFWLPPMEEDASRNMIAEMVPRPVGSAPQPEVQPQPQEGRSSIVEGQVSSVAGEAPTAGSAPLADSDKPELLATEGEERNFMLELAGAVGKSPRRLKRFVNTYRLLKASLDGLQRETFVVQGGLQGEYRSAMALLALATGAPRSSLVLLELLAGYTAESPLAEFEKQVQEVADPTERQYATAALATYKKAIDEAAPTVKELKTWAPQVARFSFRSART